MFSSLKPFLFKFFKRCWIIFAICITAVALMSSLFRALTPWAKQYKPQLEQRLTTLLGEPVTIQRMETGWFWFEPVIKLKNINVQSAHKIIHLKKLLVGINLFESLRHWQLQPGILYVEDLNLTLRQLNDQWQVEGLTNINKDNTVLSNVAHAPILAWILEQKKIIIKNLNLQVYLHDKTLLPLRHFNLTITNNSGQYAIKGNAYLAQKPLTSFELLAKMQLDPYKLNKAQGQAFFAVKHLQLTQWDVFLPQSRTQIKNGKANLLLWLDWQTGHIKQIQSKIELKKLAWLDKQTQVEQNLPYFTANLALKPTELGWQLAGNNIKMQLEDVKWPANEFLIDYKCNEQIFDIYVKNLILESLLHIVPNWPNRFNPILAVMPHGFLQDTRLTLKNSEPILLLTKFNHLGWVAQKSIPGLQNLAGYLYWTPNEGSLKLDSQQLTLNFLTKPSIELSQLNSSFNWEALAKGLQVNLEHFILTRPDLKVKAKGNISSITKQSTGQIDLKAQVVAEHAEQWLQYLPAKYMKHKLDLWLKQDIKQIKQMIAEMSIHGLASDFPFDGKSGEFTIKSYLDGMDLRFAPHWPLLTDIQGYLTINKRLLAANIKQAKTTNNIIIKDANLQIPDIGLDKEALLVRTTINTTADKALAYVHSSPLKQKLSALKILQMTGDLGLDLQLELPFYTLPGHDHALVLGNLVFNKDQVAVNHIINNIKLDNLEGSLQFDEKGILNSGLNATIMNYPINLIIQSVRNPNPYTEIKIKATTTSDVLREKFKLPWLSLLEGEVNLEGILTLTNDPNDLDHLQIKTSLLGMAINLPSPVGKAASALAPLTIDVNFNPQKALRLRIAYDNKLNSDLWFSWLNNQFLLERGEIRLGQGQAFWRERLGVQIIGALDTFNLEQWKNALSNIPFHNKSTNSISVNSINLLLKQAVFGSQRYPKLKIEATKVNSNEWAIRLNQQKIAAKLRYQLRENNLSGTITRLKLEKPATTRSNHLSSIRIKQIPNLDLIIEQLQFSNLNLGRAAIKAIVKNNVLHVNNFNLKTPEYILQAQGDWQQTAKSNLTSMQGSIHVNNLAQALHRFKMSPAVEAHQGKLNFKGHWPGGFQDFSLQHLKADLSIYFKNGRITNLSPETEEKLGVGKLLSVLSLQTIPRRLKLDFSDLAQDGYSFDEFRGMFEIHDGIMSTEQSHIDGPVAYASMKGNLDIINQRYNLDLEIVPHITASLPIVATIAGGPVIGMATWVASKIINHGMQKISGYTYKISGSWKSPIVEQKSIKKVNLASNKWLRQS
ncbi:transmembrane protein [Legionella busanensis]|uniref:Transmembrane protein n=1 Tax=Legionella busanensis TaxID=190655 RepID=A0A378JL09_9GAMM|nr:YhdP family protein [Legionella busanensis]STX51915.1 transmembrane protein [Legionella busanensis]